jgi:small subunit ribosomal protein S17
MAEPVAVKRGVRKERKGLVVSISGTKSVVVQVETRKRHPLYGKEMRLFAKFHAHDEASAAKVGDRVRIEETRPMSRLKRWRVIEIVPMQAVE